MFFVVFQLSNNGTGWPAISYPFPKPKAVELFNVAPSWLTVGPLFAPSRILTVEIPTIWPHQPLFISLRIIKRSDLTVFLSPGKCLVPSEIFVDIVGACALEDAINNEVRARTSSPIKPTLCFSGINP
jgi:hypothetical protein